MTDETATRKAWFLRADERGNPHTDIDRHRVGGQAWTEGNRVTPLVDGAEYFARLLDVFHGLGDGDLLLLTDWRATATSSSAASRGPRSPRCSPISPGAASTCGGWCGAPTRTRSA